MGNSTLLKWLGIAIFVFSLLVIIIFVGYLSYLMLGDPIEANGPQPQNQLPVRSQDEPPANSNLQEKLAQQSSIQKFTSLEELSEFLENHSPVDSSYYSYARGGLGMVDMVMEEAMPSMPAKNMAADSAATEAAGPAGSGGGEAAQDYSETNVQVEGVDEADIIKTDGKYVYALVKNDLYIVLAWPAAESRVLSKISFKDRPQDIFINKDKLVVFGNDYEIFKADMASRWRRRGNFTFFKVFDVSDPQNPKQIRDADLEGSYDNSRMIGDYVYFVTTAYNWSYIDGEPVLPRLVDNGIERQCSADNKCILPDIYYFDMPYEQHNFTTVTAVNVHAPKEEMSQEIYLMSNAQNMYVSPVHLYITYTKYISEYQLEMEVMRELVYPRLSQKDQDKIAGIEAVDNYILSEAEKQNKIRQILENWIYTLSDSEQIELEKNLEEALKRKYADISKELEKTVIHKIAIAGSELEYQGHGEVSGQVLNQFSMDESGGYFRIATTKSREWSRYSQESQESYSNVYVLDADLNVAGSLENLAEGERIYSARFMGDRLYLVTFKQIDPLFAIDLSNPSAPKVLGELKIPGFSNYLHPYDETTLIGLGKDTAETEWGGVRTGGLKLSLFDVSDVSSPQEIDTYLMGDAGSDSIALNDHKAFLFSRDKNLLVIPVSIREAADRYEWGDVNFVGAAVVNVDKDGFELKGRIDHSDGGQVSQRDYWRGINYYDNTVRRSLYLEDVLYTFSNNYLMMNELDELEMVKKLPLLVEGGGEDFEVVN